MPSFISYPAWIRPEIIPGLPIRWYGLMYLVAFAVTYLLFAWQLRKRNLHPPKGLVADMFFWAIVGLLVGARLFYVLIYDKTGYFLGHPLQIILPFVVADGRLEFTGISGMSYHGGLVGVVVSLAIFMRVKRLSLAEWGDMLAAGVPLGYTFGRLGNFANGELYGRITTVPWSMVFPHAETFPARLPWVKDFAAAVGIPVGSAVQVNLPRHPSQLYEAFFEGVVLWLILWLVVRKRKPYDGFVIGWYMIGYGLFRFLIEYTREPDGDIGFPITLVPVANAAQFSWLNFTTGQILSILLMVAGVIALAVFRARTHSAVELLPRPTVNLRRLHRRLR